MREIKFRGKRIDNGQWVYGQYFKTPLTDENSGTTPDAGWFFLSGEHRHCIAQNVVSFVIDVKTLGQYTGLKDKNGKEIYEEDRFRSHHSAWKSIGTIKYIDGWFKVVWDEPNYGCLNSVIRIQADQGEVIGNIWENPELLGEK